MSELESTALPHDGRRPPSEGRVEEICARHYFTPREVSRLAGYENANFRVEDGDGRRFVLKLAPTAGERRRLELELAVLDHLEEVGWRGVPQSVESRRGRPFEQVELDDGRFDLRLLTWVEGRPLAEIASPSPDLVREVGEYLAGLDRALGDLGADRHSGERPLPALWNLAEPETWPDVGAVEPAEDRRRAAEALEELAERLAVARPPLRQGLIHGDANDHNLLVAEESGRFRVAGLIDFGDCGDSMLLFEIAVAAAYLGLAAIDPWQPVPALVAGYGSRLELEERELALLLPAVRARLALSLAMSASRQKDGTADPYVLISETPARRALARLVRISAGEALERLGGAVEGPNDG